MPAHRSECKSEVLFIYIFTAVDISAIKNTNTKIIMRLPEANDCETIGRSIGLNEDQILELTRLDRTVQISALLDSIGGVSMSEIRESSEVIKLLKPG